MLEPINRPLYDNQKALGLTQELLEIFRKRKTTRFFQKADIDLEVILNAISIAGTAPSGANKQPWSFAVVHNQQLKEKIRKAAEEEERKFYEETAPEKWLNDLKPLHTDAHKEFLTEASYLIPVFSKQFNLEKEGKTTNYYVKESVGLATGFLISALHLAGLSVLTYTPTNRNFLVDLLGRPRNERTFMVLVVGVAADNAMAPKISKKHLDEIVTIYKDVKGRYPDFG
jgi:iodotyrosine deiodinase